MNTQRLFNIIIANLSSDLLILEENLERIINSNIEANEKVTTIKEILKEISLVEHSINKFRTMITNNNNTENTEENGKI